MTAAPAPAAASPLAAGLTLGERARAHVANLLPAFGLAGSRALVLDVFDLVTRESLALEVDAPLPRFSTINNDGVPLELSVSLGGHGGLRMLTEIGVPGTSVASRVNLTCARLGPLLRRLGRADAAPAIDVALAELLPRAAEDLLGWRGGLWLALGFLPGGATGLRLYVNAAVGAPRARWLRASRLLARLGRMEAVAALCDLSPLVSGFAEPLGVAIDVVPRGLGRVKLYLRSTRACGDGLDAVLAATGRAETSAQVRRFLAAQSDLARLPPTAVVLSLELPDRTPQPVDVKIDVCSHCCFASDRAAHAVTARLIEEGGWPAAPYEAVVGELAGGPLSGSALRHHAFIGLGLAHGEPPRLNVYLKPALTPVAPVDGGDRRGWSSDRAIRAAPVDAPPADDGADADALLARAVRFLLARQSPGGMWRDFELPVGPADAWVTAYVGLALRALPPSLRPPVVDAALARAADWCEAAMGPDHGWGYNAFTGSDADSTAHVIRLLTAVGRPVAPACHARLLDFQRADGGFATYRRTDPDDSWGHSHADVTPAALLALAPHAPAAAAVRAGVAYAVAQQHATGRWPSYWWRTHDYATHANVGALRALGAAFDVEACARACLGAPPPVAPFEASLRLATLARLGVVDPTQVRTATGALGRAQQVDGGWPSSPMLRLTDPRCPDPWAHDHAGTLYADGRRIFTTATVVVGLLSVATGS